MLKKVYILAIGLILSGCFMFEEDEVVINPPDLLVDFIETREITELWQTNIGRLNLSSDNITLSSNGTLLFVSTGNSEILALDIENGNEVWSQQLDFNIVSGPEYAAGRLFVSSAEGSIVSLNAENGLLNWEILINAEVSTPLTATNQGLVVGTSEGTIIGINPNTGVILWENQQEMPVLTVRGGTKPIISGGTVLAGYDNGRVAAYNLFTGDTLWEIPLSLASGTSQLERLIDVADRMVLRGNILYCINLHGYLTAIEINNGTPLWNREISSHAGVSANDTRLIVLDEIGDIYTYQAQSSSPDWTNDSFSYRDLTLPAILPGYVVTGDFEGYVHLIDITNGEVANRIRSARSPISIPILALGDNFFVLSDAGNLASYTLN